MPGHSFRKRGKANRMDDSISRQSVLDFLADLQLGISPDDNDGPLERERKVYAYTVLDWAYKVIRDIRT